MAKKISGYIKLQVPAGTANPSPPLGPALGQRGVNIMEFCKAFNASTGDLEKGSPIPTVITTGSGRPGSTFCVCALNALQNSMMLRPRWPSAGPMGGEGFAFPAGTCNFKYPVTFFAISLSSSEVWMIPDLT